MNLIALFPTLIGIAFSDEGQVLLQSRGRQEQHTKVELFQSDMALQPPLKSMQEYALAKVNWDNARLEREVETISGVLHGLSLLQQNPVCNIQDVRADAFSVDKVGKDLEGANADSFLEEAYSGASLVVNGMKTMVEMVGKSSPALAFAAGAFSLFETIQGQSESTPLTENDVKNLCAEMMTQQGAKIVEALNKQIQAVSACIKSEIQNVYKEIYAQKAGVVYFNVLSDTKAAENVLAAIALMPRDTYGAQATSHNEALMGCLAANNYNFWMNNPYQRNGSTTNQAAADQSVASVMLTLLPVMKRWHTACKMHSLSLLALVNRPGVPFPEDYIWNLEVRVADSFMQTFAALEAVDPIVAEPYRLAAANHANYYHQLKLHKTGWVPATQLTPAPQNGKASVKSVTRGIGEVYPNSVGGTACKWTNGTCRKCGVHRNYHQGGLSQGDKPADAWHCWEEEAADYAGKKACVEAKGFWAKEFKISFTEQTQKWPPIMKPCTGSTVAPGYGSVPTTTTTTVFTPPGTSRQPARKRSHP